VLSYVAVLLVGAAAGIGGVLVSHGLDADRVTVGNQSTAGSRGQLSVTMTARTGATDIRAIAVGLRPGDEYDLIVIGQDGRNYVAAHGVAAGGPQTIVGTAPVTRDEIRFFALTQGNLLLVAFGS
jgi:autotransporter adhesin